jgi:hypothetical protein
MAPQRPPNLPDIQVSLTSETTSNTITNTPTSTSNSTRQSIYNNLKSTLTIPDTTIPPKSPRLEHPERLTAGFYLDRENKYTADMLSHFRTIVSLASMKQEESAAAKEVAASEGLRMDLECMALVCESILIIDFRCGVLSLIYGE